MITLTTKVPPPNVHELNLMEPPADELASRISIDSGSTRTQSTNIEDQSLNSTFERPAQQHEIEKLHRVPMRSMLTLPSIQWAASILNYKGANKCWDRIIVSIRLIFKHYI